MVPSVATFGGHGSFSGATVGNLYFLFKSTYIGIAVYTRCLKSSSAV